MDDLQRWLTLKFTRGLGEKRIKRLFSRFGSSESILKADLSSLKSLLGERTAAALRNREGVNPERLDRVLKTVEREGISYVTLESRDYPRRLLDLPDPPPVLFYRGKLRDTPLAGVVGPRKPTAYTVSFVEDTVAKLVRAGYGTVSGGAAGVDSVAHISAFENSGYTVCVKRAAPTLSLRGTGS